MFLSCGGTSSQTSKPKQVDENWQIANWTITSQTYTPRALLDTSFKTLYAYTMGIPADTIKSIVVRQYDNNRLTNVNDFTLEKNGSKTLSSEIIKRFDANGNLILDLYKMDSNIVYKAINEYNDKKQLVKSITSIQKRDENLNDNNIDSLIAQLHDQKRLQYDTTINAYTYDKNGNQISIIISDPK